MPLQKCKGQIKKKGDNYRFKRLLFPARPEVKNGPEGHPPFRHMEICIIL